MSSSSSHCCKEIVHDMIMVLFPTRMQHIVLALPCKTGNLPTKMGSEISSESIHVKECRRLDADRWRSCTQAPVFAKGTSIKAISEEK